MGLDSAIGELLREIVREEVKSAMATVARNRDEPPERGRWMTPPRAARELGISEKAVRSMIRTGLVVPRLRNIAANPKQPKYLVNVDEVALASERFTPSGSASASEVSDGGPTMNLQERAARIRAKSAGR